MIRSLITFAAVLLISRACCAATFTFDGFIERETQNPNDDHHTLDFFRIHVPSPSLLTIVGTEGSLPDLSVRLYRQGPQGSLELSGLQTTPLSDTVQQIQGVPAVGNYVLAVLPGSATDWDRFEGLKSNFGVSGQPLPFGLGSYHIDINGDFTITEILEGHLDIPEPSTFALAALGILALLALRFSTPPRSISRHALASGCSRTQAPPGRVRRGGSPRLRRRRFPFAICPS